MIGFKDDKWNGLAHNTVQATGCCEWGDESYEFVQDRDFLV
jgi:hypothetical protein